MSEKNVDDRLFDFASRPAKTMSAGQKVLQGLLILLMIVVGAAALVAGSAAIGALVVVALPALPFLLVIGLIIGLSRRRKAKD